MLTFIAMTIFVLSTYCETPEDIGHREVNFYKLGKVRELGPVKEESWEGSAGRVWAE